MATLSWQARGVAQSFEVTLPRDRGSLAYGTYDPAVTPDAVGAVDTDLDIWDFDYVVTRHGEVVEGLDIRGSVRLRGFRDVTIQNCRISGTAAVGVLSAIVVGDGDNLRGARIVDSTLAGWGSPWLAGVRGGDYTIERCEITGVVDGLAFTSPVGNVTALGCWIHDGLYAEYDKGDKRFPANSGNYLHPDGIQFHRGKRYRLIGNHIGGRSAGFDHHTGRVAEIVAADDFQTTAILIKQEVSDLASDRIEDVLIARNWLEGGMATVNIASGRGNTFPTVVLRDNTFPAADGQRYILRAPDHAVLEGNIHPCGAAVVISRGA